ncbi:MAG: hypothetical protein DSY43_05860 [Gammaproteobacteria bacterium]|nr:MAG: hypothetical protein DSY43_05860 [Gammaproteobacteria bacterium]
MRPLGVKFTIDRTKTFPFVVRNALFLWPTKKNASLFEKEQSVPVNNHTGTLVHIAIKWELFTHNKEPISPILIVTMGTLVPLCVNRNGDKDRLVIKRTQCSYVE